MWSFLGWLLTGAIIGWLAGMIMGGKRSLVRNIIVGIVGSALGGWLAGIAGITATGWFASLLVSVAGACVLIVLVRFVAK